MGQTKTLGGERLGAGKKMQVELHNYGRSTHDLSYIWRSTMAAGTIVPFMTEVGLSGDTFDIELDCDVKTHPTVGPLFGSYKVQLDVFEAPVRLYNSALHNNKMGIGMKMNEIKLPRLFLTADNVDYGKNLDNQQINPSSIFSYLNIRGLGTAPNGQATVYRGFNAVPYLIYWDVYKNYYANKQEEKGAVIHSDIGEIVTIEKVEDQNTVNNITTEIPTVASGEIAVITVSDVKKLILTGTGVQPKAEQIMLRTEDNVFIQADDLYQQQEYEALSMSLTLSKANPLYVGTRITSWRYVNGTDDVTITPQVTFFALTNIDEARERILAYDPLGQFPITDTNFGGAGEGNLYPYNLSMTKQNGRYPKLQSQEGLAIKTYQSDMFNNWISTEWVDGDDGINKITAVSTAGDEFTIDALNLANKVYMMLNRIAVSGGSYNDWLDAVYSHKRHRIVESPMYLGGLSKELVFQEVVSNGESADGSQPLGTLAGKGAMSGKNKGGRVTAKPDEPCYITGYVSLTPRLDYSQGNKWDTNLLTMDDFHKPALDEIGFQDLITDQMAWWDTNISLEALTFKSAGKQPAWMNYMTNVNQVRGNFAVEDNEMFMTLNRRYKSEKNIVGGVVQGAQIQDLTTYIDPVNYNYVFAQTARDAQNFWVQIKVGITARRLMSAKIMPNL